MSSPTNYIDLNTTSHSVAIIPGNVYTIDLTISLRDFMSYTTSQSNLMFTSLATRVDVSVGGGYGCAGWNSSIASAITVIRCISGCVDI